MVTAAALSAYVQDPSANFAVARSLELRTVVLGLQAAYIHRRATSLGTSATREPTRHAVLTSAAIEWSHSAGQDEGAAGVRCVVVNCQSVVPCKNILDMAVHIDKVHYEVLRKQGVAERRLLWWTLGELAKGNAAQQALRPSNVKEMQGIVFSPPRQSEVRQAESAIKEDKRARKDAAAVPVRKLRGGSTALVSEGNCSWMDTTCKAGQVLKEEEWTAEAIVEHFFAHHRRNAVCRWARGYACSEVVGKMSKAEMAAHLAVHFEEVKTKAMPRDYQKALARARSTSPMKIDPPEAPQAGPSKPSEWAKKLKGKLCGD